jgi:hypothetical protein
MQAAGGKAKKNGMNFSVHAVPQFLRWSVDYFLAFLAPDVGTVAIVCRMRLAIL